ncbi:hypothetical protein ACF0H5_004972 [Mactra antiquata]
MLVWELVITRPPRNTTILENQRLLMHCEAAGTSKSKIRITWYHNNHEMPASGENYRIRSTGTLRFREVKVADRGIYYCTVESGKIILSSDPAYLVVQAKVQIIEFTPRFGQLSLPFNSNVRLMCKAAGIPSPKIQWRKKGQSIVDEAEHDVEITEEWVTEGVVLQSVLVTGNLTETTKFECEANNVHAHGPEVQSKHFTIEIRPSDDTDKRVLGMCAPYNGTKCSSVLGSGSVFYNLSTSNPYEVQEKMAAELIDKMYAVETSDTLKERCQGHGEKFICNYIFPPCDTSLVPKPVPICKESCIAVKELFCYAQWSFISDIHSTGHLPSCETILPSKSDDTQTCTDAKLFEREEDEVTSHCYVDKGRWYNGTVNVTRSGKPCQHWSSTHPRDHRRWPSVYKELEDAENYCRNAGAEEASPWCYIDSEPSLDNRRWDFCDIPACASEEKLSKQEDIEEVSWLTILIITIVGSVGIFMFSVVSILCYHMMAKRRQAVRYENTPQDDLEIDIQKLPANMSYHCVEEPVRLNPKLQAYEYPRNDIIYIKDIGQGAFGRVFKAKAPNINSKYDEEALVAVKMLKEDASDDLQADFEREASLMAEFDHPNIVKFLGVCAIGKPMCLLFEFMSKGDLNDYLRMCSPEMYINLRKHNTIQLLEGETLSLDLMDQIDISRQIAAGMVYLSDKCYVHRDLATRNCLISNNLTVKISDFGLARSVHRLEYYKGSDNDAIPIRWMPLESILYNKFSTETDVWSFGVILWEIFSFALQPYYGMTHEEVVEYLKEGKNLVCPENTPQQVYELMLKCWNRKPTNRPKFQLLHNALSALHEELTKKRMKDASQV